MFWFFRQISSSLGKQFNSYINKKAWYILCTDTLALYLGVDTHKWLFFWFSAIYDMDLWRQTFHLDAVRCAIFIPMHIVLSNLLLIC